jgi:hypothetical protein
MTIEEKVCRQEGIIVGLEIAISSVERAEDKTEALVQLRKRLEEEKTALRTVNLKNGYEPVGRR